MNELENVVDRADALMRRRRFVAVPTTPPPPAPPEPAGDDLPLLTEVVGDDLPLLTETVPCTGLPDEARLASLSMRTSTLPPKAPAAEVARFAGPPMTVMVGGGSLSSPWYTAVGRT